MNGSAEWKRRLFCCPSCHGLLDWRAGVCSRCGAGFGQAGGILDFVGEKALADQSRREIVLHEDLASDYGARYGTGFSRVYSDYWNDQFLRHLPETPQTVLDCGCGTGDLLRSLAPLCELVLGTDISRAMLDRASPLMAANVLLACGAGEAMPLVDETFDVVCFRGALHHMAKEKDALREAARVLKPGGRLMLSEPNDDSLLLRWPRAVMNSRMARFGNDHKAFRSKPWLSTIEGAGFEILESKYFSFLSQPLCGMSDVFPVMRYLPASTTIARGLVHIDEICARIPLVQRQSFDLFVVAQKR